MSQSTTDTLQNINRVIDTEDCGVELYLARKNQRFADDDEDANPYKFGRVNIQSQMADHLESLVSEEVQSVVDDLDDDEDGLAVAPYDIANKNRDEDLVQHLSFDEIEQSNRFEPIINGSVDQEDSFTSYYDINFVAIRFRPSDTDTTIVAFQTFTKGQVLKTDESLILSTIQGAVSDSEEPVYDAEVEDTMYQLPYRIDAVYNEDTIYVFDQRRFESIFDYYDEFRNAADEVITDLRDIEITIDGMEHIETAYQDFPNAARLFYDVRELGRYENLDQNSLEYLYENFSPDSIIQADGEYQLEVTDRFDVWGFLRVLNDSHLESSITDSRYISLSKQSTNSDIE
jgi:hypothetical protein